MRRYDDDPPRNRVTVEALQAADDADFLAATPVVPLRPATNG